MDDLGSLIERKAAQYGEDADTAKAIAMVESSGRNIPASPGHSAAGVFQFMPGTWAKYGNGKDVNDPEANVDAGIRLMADNRKTLSSKLGRDVSPGELYLAHQQGAGGALNLLSNPGARAGEVVPLQNILQNGGSPGMSAGAFANLWANKLAGKRGADLSGVFPNAGPRTNIFRTDNTGLGDGSDPMSLSVPATSVKTYDDLYTPPENSSPDQQMAHREATTSLWQATKDAYSTSSLTGSVLRGGQLSTFAADDKPYMMSKEEFDRRTQGLAPQYHDWFQTAVSSEHADAIERSARQNQDATERLSDAGWTGTGLKLLAGVLDPTAIGLGIATGGLGNAATKAYQLGTVSRIGINAAIGAVGNVAADKALEALGDPEHHSVGMAIATGALFGAAYGMLSHGPHSDQIITGARRTTKDIERSVTGEPPEAGIPHTPDASTPSAKEGPPQQPGEPRIIQPEPENPRPTGDTDVDAAIKRTRTADDSPAPAPEAPTQTTTPNTAPPAGTTTTTTTPRPAPETPTGEPPVPAWKVARERRKQRELELKRIQDDAYKAAQEAHATKVEAQRKADEAVAAARKQQAEEEARRRAAAGEVNTQVVSYHPELTKHGQLIQELAAKFNIEKLIRVVRVQDDPDPGARTALGYLAKYKDGTYTLAVNTHQRVSVRAQIEAVTHEFGHLLDHEFFGNGPAGKINGGFWKDDKIKAAYERYYRSHASSSVQEFFKDTFGPALYEHFSKQEFPNTRAYNLADWHYRSSSAEWWAQEVSKWTISNKEPLGLIEGIFKKVADYWKKLYFIAKGKQPTASAEVKAFIEARYNAKAKPTPGYTGTAATAALDGTAGLSPIVHKAINWDRPQLASGRGLSALEEEDVSRTFAGRGRFSIAARLGSSKNPGVRALGSALVEDAPGKADGAVNSHSAELFATQRTKAAQTAMAQARKVAWDKWKTDNNIGWLEGIHRESEFEEAASLAIRAHGDPILTQDIHPAIKQYASHLHAISETARKLGENPFHEEGLDGRPVQGFGSTKEDYRYLTRVYSPKKMSDIVKEPGGYEKLERLIHGAILSAQPNIEPALLNRLSKGFTKSMYKRAYGVIDEKVSRMFAVDNLEMLERDLKDTHGLSEDDAREIVARLRKGSDAGNDTRAKHRVLMDENYTSPDGLKFSDVTVNNATALTAAYVRHMYGKVAMARVRIRDPKTGDLLVNGITNDGEWNAALQTIREHGHDLGVNHKELAKEMEALQTAHDQLLGIPHEQYDTDWAKLVRVAGKFNLVRLGHQFTFAQAGEIGNMMGELGLKAMIQQVPSFRRIITGDGRWIKAQGLDREIESIFGLGTDRLRAHVETHHADEIRSLPMEATGFLDKADRGLTTAGHAVLELSGFHLLDGAMKQWTGKAIAQKFADMAARAKKLPNGGIDVSHINFRRMAKLGFDESMLKRVIGEVQSNFTRERGMLFDHKVTRMNLDKWGDQEARIAFEGALTRFARQVIQENDIGSMHQWMSHPLWRMIMQFRAFPLHAWDKQLMHGLAMHDTSSVTSAVLGAAIPTMIYAAQSHVQALGRSDGDEWLAKRLAPDKLASAAFQRHGMSSLLPQAIDTGRMLLGQKGIFDARTTQQPSDALFGNPTTGLITDIGKGIGAVANPVMDGRNMSQDEARDIARIFGNNLVTNGILNQMIRDMPAHAPKQFNH